VAERHAGTRRARSIRRPEMLHVNSVTRISLAGSSSHNQDGDRIEDPANTGCSTHGDFSAPMVSAPGTTGGQPGGDHPDLQRGQRGEQQWARRGGIQEVEGVIGVDESIAWDVDDRYPIVPASF
jgi:hypothetical protein